MSLEDYTVVALKEMAKDQGITGYSTMRKAELIEALGQTQRRTRVESTPYLQGTSILLCAKGDFTFVGIGPEPDLSLRIKIGQVNIGEVAEIGREVNGCCEMIQNGKNLGYVIKDAKDYESQEHKPTGMFGGTSGIHQDSKVRHLLDTIESTLSRFTVQRISDKTCVLFFDIF